jgi:hypothetical protein
MPTTDPRLATTARVLSTLAGVATSASPYVPGTAGTVVGAIGAALGLGADIAAVGLDPVVTIERAKSAEDALREMRARWAARRKTAVAGD